MSTKYFNEPIILLFFTLLLILSGEYVTSSGTFFTKIGSFHITNQSWLIGQFSIGTESLKCFHACTKNSLCSLVEINSVNQTCFMFSFMIFSQLTSDYQSEVYVISRYLPYTLVGLTHYWPINADMTDYMTGKDLIVNGAVNLDYDRYSKPVSVLSLNNSESGFLTLPPDVYFAGDFTFIAWIYVNSYGRYERIIDCGNGEASDNVIISYNYAGILYPYFSILTNSTVISSNLISSVQMTTNQWTYIAVTLLGTNATMYINGAQTDTWNSNIVPRNVTRYSCYLGKSNYPDDYADAKFDGIKIYNRALSANEIWNDFNSLM